ncbi:hypothetical protein LG943_03710 [Streptomonospora sp. S1-112]|uniref:Uncharacterized protein n=1 Tax=Streptomonospora mangrovi TaxID=2883123 RepID=A0A9X3NKF8_9ACTN|nr:hypothetical protein [Streptomonospora mangrovi]MDA0563439.1 hypothetical protein [Streptomonospora mangrovi]
MIDEFRAAFQELIDASVATDPQRFPAAVHQVYHLASQVPAEERELALEALGPFLGGGQTVPGVTADLAVVAGALVEMGTDPGSCGIEVVRLLRSMGQGAAVFLYAWERTGSGPPPEPDEVTSAAEERVSAELGESAPTATLCWWTIRRHGLAAKTMLSEASVRNAVRADPGLRAELVAIANQLRSALPEFDEVRELLRMSEATSALVLDRATGRGFRVLFDGIGDNFQLHTLLADALIGPEGRGLPGRRPDPRWTASFRDSAPDPEARVVRGWWNLVALDGSWVWNEGVPADIPTVEGERVLVLEPQPYERSWTAGRRHPHVRGWLEVEEEVSAEEAARWWGRAVPGQSMEAAMSAEDDKDDEGDVASEGAGLFAPTTPPGGAEAAGAPGPDSFGQTSAPGADPGPAGAPLAPGREAGEAGGVGEAGAAERAEPEPAANPFAGAWPPPERGEDQGQDQVHQSQAQGQGRDVLSGPGESGAEAAAPGPRAAEEPGGAQGAPLAWGEWGEWPGGGSNAGEARAAAEPDGHEQREPGPRPWGSAAHTEEAPPAEAQARAVARPAPWPGAHEDWTGGQEGREDAERAEAAEDAGTGPERPAPTSGADLAAQAAQQPAAGAQTDPGESSTAPESTPSADGPPGAGLLPPLPPGVSDNRGWGPTWL